LHLCLDLSWVYDELSPHYPALGRPSIDLVLMIRMLILGYAFGLRSERLLCRNARRRRDRIDAALRKAGIKLPAADLKLILKAVSWRVEAAPPVIAKLHKPGKAKADPLRGLFETPVGGKHAIVRNLRYLAHKDPAQASDRQTPVLQRP
jgi:hypothetical protein